MPKPLSYYFIRGESLKRFYDTSANLIGLVNSFLTITFLSVFQFGIFQLLLSFITILDGFNIKNLDGPIAVEMRHYIKNGESGKARKIFKDLAGIKIGLALAIAVAVFFGSGIISNLYGEDMELLIKIVSSLLVLYALKSIQTVFLKSILSLSYWSFPAIRELAKLLILVSFFLFHQFGILELVIAHVAAEAISVATIAVAIFFRKYRETFATASVYTQRLMLDFLKKHGKWIFIGYGLSRITKNTIPWLVKFFVNTEAVAFYSLALNLVSFIESFIPIAGIDQLMILKVGEEKELGFIFKRSMKYVFWLGGLFLVLSVFFVPWLVALIFPKYIPAIPLFRILILALPIFGLYKILKSALVIFREYKILTMRILNETLIILLGAPILLPLFGLLGAGVIYIVTYIERVWFFYAHLTKQRPLLKIKLKDFFRIDVHDWEILTQIGRRVFRKFSKTQ